MSDRLYILMEVEIGDTMGDRSFDGRWPIGPPRRRFPRWAAIHRDKNFMAAAAIAVAWSEESPTDEDTEAGAIQQRRDMRAICDSCIEQTPSIGASRDERMDPRLLEEVVGTLLPGAMNEEDGRFTKEEVQEPQPPEKDPRGTAGSWSPESRVTEKELAEAVERIGTRNAPVHDGIPAHLWKDVAGVLAPRLMSLFDGCLSRSEFPVSWKEGRIVLLSQPGRSPDSLSVFQSVCLLDEAGKLLK